MVDFFIFIKEQQKVELIFNKDRRIYGIITSVIGDRVTIVTEQKVNPNKNQVVEINTYSENGVYSGITKVVDSKWEYKKRSIIVEYPKEIKHSQRREYLRANIKAKFELTVENEEKTSSIRGETKDICGKGISFYYEKPLSQFLKYNVKIKLKNREMLSSCQLVYTKVAIVDMKPKFINAFVLTGITVDDTKFIVDECMNYHLKQK